MYLWCSYCAATEKFTNEVVPQWVVGYHGNIFYYKVKHILTVVCVICGRKQY